MANITTRTGKGAALTHSELDDNFTNLNTDKAELSGADFTGNVSVDGNISVTGTVDGRDVATDGTKLDGIEANADVTDTTNVVASLTAGTNITIAADGTISATDSDTVLTSEQVQDIVGAMVSGNTETGITVTYQDADGTIDFVVASQTDENFTTTLKNKLDAIEANADVTDTTNVVASLTAGTNVTIAADGTISATDTNTQLTTEQVQDIVGAMFSGNTETGIAVTYQDDDGTVDFVVTTQSDENFTTVLKNKLDGIEAGATADQTNAEIRAAVEAATDSNVFTDADHTKLNGIEASADVTDTDNVVASLTAGSNITISAGGVIASTASGDVVDDTTPQLGGNLDLNSNDITGTGNINTTGDITASGTAQANALNVGSSQQLTVTNIGKVTTSSYVDASSYRVGTTSVIDNSRNIENVGNITLSGTVDGRDVAADGTKLDGIEASADVTDTANVTAAGAVMDSELTSEASVKALNQGVATTDSPSFAGLTVDTNTLKVDSTNNRVGILNAAPDVTLDVGSATDAVHVPVGTTAQRPSSPAAGYLRYNSTTGEFEGYTTAWSGLGSGSAQSDVFVDTMTGNGSTTTLTLANGAATENNTQVYIDGVYQSKSTYSLSGTTITFSEAPPNLSEVEVITIEPTTINEPADGSVTSAKLSGDLTTPGNLTVGGDAIFGDNDKASFGGSQDLQIYHDGSNSYIYEAGTGDLVLQTNGTKIGMAKASPFEWMLEANADGAVTLYYNNSAKLATTSTGIDVTGSISADGLTVDVTDQVIINHSGDGGGIRIDSTNGTNTGSLRFGDDLDNYIGAVEYNHSTNTLSLYADNATRVAVNSSGIDVTGSVVSDGLTVNGDVLFEGAVNDVIVNSSTNSYPFYVSRGVVKTEALAIGVDDSDAILNSIQDERYGGYKFQSTYSGTGTRTRMQIGQNTGDISFYDSAGTSPAFYWDASTSRLGLGETNPNHELHIKSASPQIRLDDSDGTNTYGDLQYNGVSLNIISRGGASSYGAITFARTDGANTYNTAQINAAGDFRFYDNSGTAKMRWDASEEALGIGTETPSNTLDIKGTVGFEATNSTNQWLAYTYTDNSFRLNYNGAGADEVVIDNGGNVILTKPNGAYLQLKDASAVRGAINVETSDGLVFTTGASFTERMRITSAGAIDVHGDSINQQTSAAWYIRNRVNGGSLNLGVETSAGALYYPITMSGTSNVTIFRNATTEIARFASNGYLGIDNNLPSDPLTIGDGTVSSMGLGIKSTNTGNNYIHFGDSDSSTSGKILYDHNSDNMQFNTGGTLRGFYNSGGLTITANSGSTSHFFTYNENGGEIQLYNAAGQIGTLIDQVNTATRVLELKNGSAMQIGHGSSNTTGIIEFRSAGFGLAGVIDANANWLFGKSGTAFGTAGVEINQNGVAGKVFMTRSGGDPLSLNRLSSDGEIQGFYKDGTQVGSIGTFANDLALGKAGAGLRFEDGTVSIRPHNITTNAGNDDAVNLGWSDTRFDNIYATNGTIQTSDRNEKQDIEELSEAEQRVAVAAKGLLRKYRWVSRVETKGDDARIHFGIIAQDLQDAFTAEGLDAGRYGMFINSTWTDEETGEERSRMGVRYSELLAFIISAI